MSVTQIQTSGINNDAITIDKITFENSLVPVGGIIMWSGLISAIPTGWALCNGTNNTPDLRNRFVVGAHSGTGTGITPTTGPGFNATTGDLNNSYTPGNVGGSTAVGLTTAQMPAHNHSLPSSVSVWFMNPADRPDVNYVNATYRTSNTGTSGGSEYHENRPPYYALAFIMRVS